MQYRKHLLSLIIVLSTAVVPAIAQIPRTISFQGVLADAAGTLIPDGPQDLTISIYDVATGGTPLFSETQRVTVVRGVFNAIIGATDPAGIPAAIAFDMPYYLGVRVGSGTELAPRTPFTSVPYALNAAMAQRAIVANTADTATWAMTADTTANIRGGHVVSVNGQQGAIEFLGQGATTVTRTGNQFIIRSTDTSSGGIRRIDNFDGSLVIDPPQGPFVTMFIREGGVQTHHLRDLSVTTSKLAIGAVGTNQIADAAITNPKLAPNAVTSDKIMDGTIVTADLADNSVTSPKIVDGQVLTQDIGLNQVIASRIGTEGATTGFALLSNGTATPYWANPITANIPFAGTFNAAQTLWDLTNTGTGAAGRFAINNAANGTDAVTGTTNGTGSGVFGAHTATTGVAAGVRGESSSQDGNAVAVLGTITSTAPGGFSSGVRGVNNGTGGLGIGVYGSQAGSGWGVYGTTPNGIGVHGNSTNGFGVYGLSTAGTGVYGLSTSGEAGRFEITNPANISSALRVNSNGGGFALNVLNTGTGGGAIFQTTNPTSGNDAILAVSNGFAPTIRADNSGTNGGAAGFFWSTNAANTGNALEAVVQGLGSAAVFNSSNAGSTTATVRVFNSGLGESINARRGAGTGISLASTPAIRGDNANGIGVAGTGTNGVGVYGTSTNNDGVWGVSLTAGTAGVRGRNDVAGGYGIWGQSFGSGTGVYGTSTNGTAGLFENTNAGNAINTLTAQTNGAGAAISAINTGTGKAGNFLINNAANASPALDASSNGSGAAILSTAIGTGEAGNFRVQNAASTTPALRVSTTGIGNGISVQLTNASNGARGIDVLQTGVGPGVFATSAGGNAVWGITSSISAAGVIGDNTFGEAVVGRNRGGVGVGAVVGRNDSSGYGVRGFNTKDGIGVLGQAGISGGTGVGGRFENVNAANGSDALQAVTNGTGWAGNFTSTNGSPATRGVRIATTAGQGGTALHLANGAFATSVEPFYAPGTPIDDAILVVPGGGVTILGPAATDGTHVWVVNASPVPLGIANSTVPGFTINPNMSAELIFVAVLGTWVPVQ
jgi:hypothetical protein